MVNVAFSVTHGEELKKPLETWVMVDAVEDWSSDGVGHYNHWIWGEPEMYILQYIWQSPTRYCLTVLGILLVKSTVWVFISYLSIFVNLFAQIYSLY